MEENSYYNVQVFSKRRCPLADKIAGKLFEANTFQPNKEYAKRNGFAGVNLGIIPHCPGCRKKRCQRNDFKIIAKKVYTC